MIDVDRFHRDHRGILQVCDELAATAKGLSALTPAERERERERLLRLVDPLEAHMLLDERLLFHEVCDRLGDPLGTASMSYDHRAIRDWLRRLRTVDVDDVPAFEELLYGLSALIRVHVWKERDLYLAMLASASWPASV